MNRKNYGLGYGLGLVTLAGILYKGISMYNNFKEFSSKLDVSIYDISINSAKTKESNYSKLFFRARFWILNPTNFTGTAQGITAALVINGKTTVVLKRNLDTRVLPKGKTPITADFEINTLELGDNLASLISGGLKNLDIKIKGTIIVNKIPISFNLPAKLK
jgi:hypothetical protein